MQGGIARLLILNEGVRVMLNSNMDVQDKLNNVQIDNVLSILELNWQASIVYVKFEDLPSRLKISRGDHFTNENNVLPIRKNENKVKFCQKNPNSKVIRTTQFPLMLVCACTIDKVQVK